jgi:hypothetical protein
MEKYFDSITDPISIHDKHYNILEVIRLFKKIRSKIRGCNRKEMYEIIHKLHAPFKECPFKKPLLPKKLLRLSFLNLI